MELAVTSGTTVKLSPPYDFLLITNGSTVAALTIALPDPTSTTGPVPADGDMVWISTVSAVTALTVTPTPLSVPTGLAATSGQGFMYSANQAKWFAL